MDLTTSNTRTRRVPSLALIGFYALTFGITWGIVAMYILAPDWATARFGEISGSHPFFFIATWAPCISAVTLVLLFGGVSGLKSFLSRLTLWRVPLPWMLLIALGLPAVYMIGSLLKGGPLLTPLPPKGLGAMVSLTFMMLFLGPIEEFGWRGVAQPILQRHVAPLFAGMIIGTVWGIWHLPAFFLANTVFATWNFLPFLIGNITLAVLVTPLFNASRGSLLWPMLFHWQLILPIWPDAQPYDTWLYLALTVVVVWLNRNTMLRRAGAVTEVIPAAS
ncbi:CPBP family intramembrane glutamic endopeptidase [Celeribacter litoreus]|uniref:CPBP family intramembrane glutamic endopeptidase n=1 Tax=Celeribacter litoreus TaxID=2876714 RepID=UPI001CD0119C|nr:CPBP family intramembrane glutamic endopeptidase [Celeribacter litoreus]MCA0043336.1 CPBP family intramembrane metalloprotease [Celeribacter litoreus]